MVISTGGAVDGRALRAKRCCRVRRQWARCARERGGEGVHSGGKMGETCTKTLSRHGEADSVTNPPTRWDERQGQKGVEVADLLVPHWAVDAGLR
jgi:hypothetical protein